MTICDGDFSSCMVGANDTSDENNFFDFFLRAIYQIDMGYSR